MRLHKYFTIIICAYLLVAGTTSCKKYLTVEPTTNIPDDQFFTNELAFKEALNGVYLRMGDNALYGRSLTYGAVDVLAGMYLAGSNILPSNYQSLYTGAYLTGNANAIALIDPIWVQGYNAIANLNRLIEALEATSPTIFSGNNYEVLKGEAYGLRAFLHFDLLRLFGKSPLAGGMNEAAIPYRTEYSKNVYPRLNGSEVIAKLNADLTTAENLLQVDPIKTRVAPTTDDSYLTIANRKMRFNYYAVKALKARVALWANNKPEALSAAQEVISAVNAGYFAWTASSALTGNEASIDRILSNENIFTAYVPHLKESYVNLINPNTNSTSFRVNAARVTEQYEGSTSDLRAQYLIRNVTGTNAPALYFAKIYQPEGINTNYALRIPLIRIPEMYYIAAESLINSDPITAIDHINTVRTRRLLTALPTNLNATAIQDEIRKEYWKEFPLEGQMFYYYKRTGATSIPGTTSYPQERYVLPLPVSEVEFGR